jgi:predicted transcriptional regulator
MAVQLTPDLEQELQHLAAQSNSTPDELAQHALEDFVAYRRDLNEAVARADEDFASGRVVAHEDVVARIELLLQSKSR